jgi:hypothetical protein
MTNQNFHNTPLVLGMDHKGEGRGEVDYHSYCSERGDTPVELESGHSQEVHSYELQEEFFFVSHKVLIMSSTKQETHLQPQST